MSIRDLKREKRIKARFDGIIHENIPNFKNKSSHNINNLANYKYDK